MHTDTLSASRYLYILFNIPDVKIFLCISIQRNEHKWKNYYTCGLINILNNAPGGRSPTAAR